MMIRKSGLWGTALLVLGLLGNVVAADDELRIVSWNLDSGGSDPSTIAQQLKTIGTYHLYGLTEVDPGEAERYAKSLGESFAAKLSMAGGPERLMMLYDTDRLALVSSRELNIFDDLRAEDQQIAYRKPLLLRLRDRPSEVDLLVVLNHLERDDVRFQREQAKALRLWCEEQKLAVIGIGDYNFDFNTKTLRGNTPFNEFMLDYRWHYIRPSGIADSHWLDRNQDGHDDQPDTLSDCAFLAGGAQNWLAGSRVLVRKGDFPDDRRTSNHRPVELTLSPR
ncbi:MAG: hypothetical protein P8N76_22605 [Pirellulaceae bacterium]|nr:hypothetical protein [Pirellulaceae bacterium]